MINNPISSAGTKVDIATPQITVSSSGLITASSSQSKGLVEQGTRSSTKQLTTKGTTSITPSTSTQTVVSSGVYTTGNITVTGDSDLIPENIRLGSSIFNVNGTYEGETVKISQRRYGNTATAANKNLPSGSITTQKNISTNQSGWYGFRIIIDFMQLTNASTYPLIPVINQSSIKLCGASVRILFGTTTSTYFDIIYIWSSPSSNWSFHLNNYRDSGSDHYSSSALSFNSISRIYSVPSTIDDAMYTVGNKLYIDYVYNNSVDTWITNYTNHTLGELQLLYV